MINNIFRISAGLIGFILFALCGGLNILDVHNISWFGSGDAAQHWLGWNFFRNTPILQWPLGLNEPYGLEVSSSIVFTDSIPLFALFFKIISFALPDTFQYTGLWMMTCCVLQGMTSYELINRNTNDKLYSLLGSAVFCLAPIMLFRMVGHFALSAHFLIITSFLLYGISNANKRWIALIALSSAVHFYLTGMILSVFIAYLAKSVIAKDKTIKNAAALFACSMLALAITMYALGYFVIADGAGGKGYGLYHMNLNGFYNPMFEWASSIINPLGHQKFDYEGFSYLGVGVIALIVMSCILSIKNASFQMSMLPAIVVCTMLTLFALSNNIAFGNHSILTIPLPDIVSKLFNVFRSSGRFVWVVIYALIAFAIVVLRSKMKRVACILILSMLVALQYYDIKGMIGIVDDRYSENHDISNGLDSSSFDSILAGKRKIEVIMPFDFYFDWPTIGYMASKNKVGMNFGYMARYSLNSKRQQQENLYETMFNGVYNTDSLYLFKDKWTLELAVKNVRQPYHVVKIGDYYAMTVSDSNIDNKDAIDRDSFFRLLNSHYK